MLRTALTLLLPAATMTACAIVEDEPACTGGKCDGAGGGVCPDKRYGDGTCNIDLDCATPDIDCFHTFDDDAAGAAWFAELEPRVAAAEGRPARRIISSEDPRFAKVRALLDRGWDAMRDQRPVGLLADRRPALVFVEDSSVNAFVMPDDLDQKRASFAVMIHTATLDIPTSDDANLGLMMHELQHAVGLHVVAGVKERIQTFYTAPETREPIGRREPDNTRVRDAVTRWRSLASEVGSYANAELHGLPVGGDLGRVFRTVVQAGFAADAAGCQHTRDALTAVSADLQAATDPVSGAPRLDAAFGARVLDGFEMLRDECLRDYHKTFVDVVAEIAGATPAQIEGSMTAEDKALIAGKHIVDQIAALSDNRRTAMRALQAAFETEHATPWSRVRFFSEEEDADDVTVPVLRGAGLDPTGLGTFFLEVLMSGDAGAACRGVLKTGAVPAYGVDLLDTHHGNCWRTYHVGALAADTAKARVHARPLGTPLAPVRGTLPIPAERRYATY